MALPSSANTTTSNSSNPRPKPTETQPANPPPLPASTFETIPPLLTILERLLSSSGGPAQVGGIVVPSAATPDPAQPLSIKEFTSEVLRVKHAAAAARVQLRGLPDLERGIAEQRAEEARLRRRLEIARGVRREIGIKAEEVVREMMGQQGDGAGKEGEGEMLGEVEEEQAMRVD